MITLCYRYFEPPRIELNSDTIFISVTQTYSTRSGAFAVIFTVAWEWGCDGGRRRFSKRDVGRGAVSGW